MNRRVRDTLFFYICFLLIFNDVPKMLQVNFFGGSILGNKLSFYPLIIGMIYTIWCQYRGRQIFVPIKKLKKWSIVYFFILFVSLIIGIFMYPFYDVALAAPVEQIEKLPKVIAFFENVGISIDTSLIMGAWIIFRQIKSIFIEFFWGFGGAYLIYCWYRNKWGEGVSVLRKSILCGFIVICGYSVFEVAYLYGNEFAQEILVYLTPFIHTVNTNHGWWPPLLWKGQLRMIFPEPSHVGNYIAILLPVLCCYFLRSSGKNKLFFSVMIFLLSFFVFLTNARTAYAMLCGIIGLLFLLLFWIKQTRQKVFKDFISICFCIFVGFFSYMGFINIVHDYSKNEVSVEKAIDSNLLSLASENERSNGARYALLKSGIRIAGEYPILGVGKGLASEYIVAHFTDEESKNSEVAKWIKYQNEKGPFASGYSLQGNMNEYVTRLVQTGILGLVIWLLPFLFIIIKLFSLYKRENGDEQLQILMILLSLIATMVAGCNGTINIFYSVWILLGLGASAVFSKSKH